MRCPKCTEAGLTSTCKSEGAGIRTLVSTRPFYDEKDRLHDHDVNTTRYDMVCSNGHRWTYRNPPVPCWCGWGEAVSESA
jgi:hypothetical protein